MVCVPEVIRNPFDFAQGSAALEAATQSQTTSAGFHTNEISGYVESSLSRQVLAGTYSSVGFSDRSHTPRRARVHRQSAL
ncbi:MAG: hypothetical protein H8E73_07390 [Planctomycetes bacterium]|nr:hypothetical protein [Planctomycetota bacterium]